MYSLNMNNITLFFFKSYKAHFNIFLPILKIQSKDFGV
jgi:hypothetical protein